MMGEKAELQLELKRNAPYQYRPTASFLLAARGLRSDWKLFSDLHLEHEKTQISLSHLLTGIVYTGRKCECKTLGLNSPSHSKC
jgi:hypothetical protein